MRSIRHRASGDGAPGMTALRRIPPGGFRSLAVATRAIAGLGAAGLVLSLLLLPLVPGPASAARVVQPLPPAQLAPAAPAAPQKAPPPQQGQPAAGPKPSIDKLGARQDAKPVQPPAPTQPAAPPSQGTKQTTAKSVPPPPPPPPAGPDLDKLSAELDGLVRDPGFPAKSWARLEEQFAEAGNREDAAAPRALFLLGRLREERGGRFAAAKDLKAARKTYGEVTRRFPKSGFADDALYRRALVARDLLGDAEAAKTDLTLLLKEYPSGDMAAKGRQALDGKGPRLELSGHPQPGQNQIPAQPQPPQQAVGKTPPASPAPPAQDPKGSQKADQKTDPKADHLQQALRQSSQQVAQQNTKAPSQPAPPSSQEGKSAEAKPGKDAKSPAQQTPPGAQQAAPGPPALQPLGPLANASSGPGSGRKPPMLLEQLGLSVRTVMIDAGHGGKDPGAVANGVKEKDVVLKVALYLGEELRRRGFEVAYTRNKDVFIPLEARPAMANKRKADLYISIHCNSAPDPSAHGIETYTLNWARTVDAVRVASRENAAASRGVGELRSVLAELLAGSRKKESDDLACTVQAETLRCARDAKFDLRDHGTKEGPFYVLVGATMPAALVELGYLTNPAEAEKLKSDAYQRALAKGLADGVISYKRRVERFAMQ